MDWLWIPATIIYTANSRAARAPRAVSDSSAGHRMLWNAAWTAMGLMSVVVLIALIMARERIETTPFLLALAPDGLRFVRRCLGAARIGASPPRRMPSWPLGSFFTAIVCAVSEISTPDPMVCHGIGILLSVACSGAVIVLHGRARSKPTQKPTGCTAFAPAARARRPAPAYAACNAAAPAPRRFERDRDAVNHGCDPDCALHAFRRHARLAHDFIVRGDARAAPVDRRHRERVAARSPSSRCPGCR